MKKFTPGPWKYKTDGNVGGWEIFNEKGDEVCSCCDCGQPNKADARLIAAAPELLNVLKEFLVFAKLWEKTFIHQGDESGVEYDVLAKQMKRKAEIIINKAESDV